VLLGRREDQRIRHAQASFGGPQLGRPLGNGLVDGEHLVDQLREEATDGLDVVVTDRRAG
jgi:hypothetical protein